MLREETITEISMFNWRHWCRICGNVEANEKIEPDLLQVAEEIFQIEANSSYVCIDCHTYIQDLYNFLSTSRAVNEMFLELEQKDEIETVDEKLALQLRLFYNLSTPDNSVEFKVEFEEPTANEMSEDFEEIENFILEENSVEQENAEYIIEEEGDETKDETESDHNQDIQPNSQELIEPDAQDAVIEKTMEFGEDDDDEFIFEEVANEVSDNDNEQFLEEQQRDGDEADDISKHFEFRCHVCDNLFSKMHFLTTHTRTFHDCQPQVVCCCGRLIGSTKALQTHYQNHVKYSATYECLHCKKSYKTETNYNTHMTTHHGDGESSSERLYRCECGKSFKEARHLAVHSNSHLPDEQKFIHQCSYCEKRYSSVFSLRQHVKHVHVKNPTFKCPQCDKMFSRKANLDSHLNHVHTTDRNFECEICTLKVKTKGILRMHKKIHSTNPEDLLSCDVCQRQFKTQNQLTNHKISHSNDKRYKCTLCSAQYKRSKELASHIASSHTGESKYTCCWCTKTFYNNSNYRKHKLKMHSNELQAQQCKMKLDDA